MAHVVHHTLNQMVESENPLPFHEKSLTDELQYKRNTETKNHHFYPIQNQ